MDRTIVLCYLYAMSAGVSWFHHLATVRPEQNHSMSLKTCPTMSGPSIQCCFCEKGDSSRAWIESLQLKVPACGIPVSTVWLQESWLSKGGVTSKNSPPHTQKTAWCSLRELHWSHPPFIQNTPILWFQMVLSTSTMGDG